MELQQPVFGSLPSVEVIVPADEMASYRVTLVDGPASAAILES